MTTLVRKTAVWALLSLWFGLIATPVFAAATTAKQAEAAAKGWLKSEAKHQGAPLGNRIK